MKRGKDDEKTTGPMFPRLHVNDTERGGPRAPPRNKMALYEQLSIPSQRYNPGVVPLNPGSKGPAASTSQGSGLERSYHLPHQVPPSTPAHITSRSHSRQPNRGNLNTSLEQLEQRKKVGDEDDFRVPVFDQSGAVRHHSSSQLGSDMEKPVPFISTYSSHSLKIQTAGDNDRKHIGPTGVHLRQDMKNPRDEIMEACVSSRHGSERAFTNVPVLEKTVSGDKANTSQDQQLRDNAVANFANLHQGDVCLQQENADGSGDDVPDIPRETEKADVPLPGGDASLGKDHLSSRKPEIGSVGDQKFGSVQLENGSKSNDVSETSVVDSVVALDISPDDVVGIIGQKHFWKARRAIVNQQRVFAVQVFELHRLIKVQRLIAGSPNLSVEESTYLGKRSRKSSPTENLTSECVVTPSELNPSECNAQRKEGSEKPNDKMECSAENAVAKTSISSVKSGTPPSNWGPYLGNPTTVPVAADPKMSPWCVNQSMGQQWLIPVMSPSEGLIYKPYTMPGLMGSACGGCGPFAPIPMTGNFMNSPYGVPTSHHHHHYHHQGIGGIPGAPPVGHGYFPPYGMPVMNTAFSGSAVEQMNNFAGSVSNGQNSRSPVDKANGDLQHQASQNVSPEKGGTTSQVRKFQISKDAERQGSTGSSPSERAPGGANLQTTEGRDALPVFPAATAASEGAPQPQDTDQPSRVIKVVPHNPRSATASAARIFRSIQEERKQYDSI